MRRPDPDARRWRCPSCGAIYTSPLELAAAPTHRCRPEVKRTYVMIPEPEEVR